jgi:probable HAF family extracellular repeat protein
MSSKIRIPTLLLLGALIVLCTASNVEAKKLRYHYVELGTLGGTYSWSTGINNWGQVVGVSETENGKFRAFLSTAKKMKQLKSREDDLFSVAWSINDRGQTVGFSLSSGSQRRALLWDDTGLHELETFGGNESDAFSINRHGEIVGWASVPDDTQKIIHAALWNSKGLTDINPFTSDFSVASSINKSGDMVGSYETSEGLLRAILWNHEGIHKLGTLGGEESEAYWISDKGEIVGWCDLPKGVWHACLWTPRGDVVDLGALEGLYSEALSINDRGDIVGTYYFGTDLAEARAFLWTKKDGMQDLSALVDLPDGVFVVHANSINDFGWIAGTNSMGTACLLIPYRSHEDMGHHKDSRTPSRWLRD